MIIAKESFDICPCNITSTLLTFLGKHIKNQLQNITEKFTIWCTCMVMLISNGWDPQKIYLWEEFSALSFTFGFLFQSELQ